MRRATSIHGCRLWIDTFEYQDDSEDDQNSIPKLMKEDEVYHLFLVNIPFGIPDEIPERLRDGKIYPGVEQVFTYPHETLSPIQLVVFLEPETDAGRCIGEIMSYLDDNDQDICEVTFQSAEMFYRENYDEFCRILDEELNIVVTFPKSLK